MCLSAKQSAWTPSFEAHHVQPSLLGDGLGMAAQPVALYASTQRGGGGGGGRGLGPSRRMAYGMPAPVGSCARERDR